jgi:hypothetical protein
VNDEIERLRSLLEDITWAYAEINDTHRRVIVQHVPLINAENYLKSVGRNVYDRRD